MGDRHGLKWMTGIAKDTLQDEHWVPYVRDESLGSTSEAKTTLYVNLLEDKIKIN